MLKGCTIVHVRDVFILPSSHRIPLGLILLWVSSSSENMELRFMSIREPKGHTIREGGEVFRAVLDERDYIMRKRN